jgi:hypothetical protein
MAKNRWQIFLGIVLWGSCTYDHFSEIPILCAAITISLTVTVTNASTCGSSDGIFTLSASGGAKPYIFSVNGGTYGEDTVYKNLNAGNYSIIVKDGNGCMATKVASVNVTNSLSTLSISATSTANSGCSNPDGSITVTATGGKSPIQYKLTSGSYQSSNIFTGLAAGTYSITVVDATGCPASTSAIVASSGPSFKSQVYPIISSYCGSCHNGGQNPLLSSYSNISASGASIVGAINNNMPPGGGLSAQQISLITCWVNNGAPNN